VSEAYNRKRHLGVDFAIWESDGAWRWSLIDPSGERGMIGATASEAEAMREARVSIEEQLKRSRWRVSPPTLDHNDFGLKKSGNMAHAINWR
jgi:hypothetical protein